MSDEMAEKAEAEKKEQQAAAEKAAEEAQKRLWALQVMFDPQTGQVGMVPNENVTTIVHIGVVLNAALAHNTARMTARMTASEMVQAMKPKPGLVPPTAKK